MVALVPQTADAALQVVRSTAPQYVKDFVDLTLKRRLWMGLINKYGRIIFNEGGHTCVWSAKIRDDRPIAIGSNPAFTFEEVDRNEQFSLGWRGYGHPGALNKLSQLQNGNAGPAQLYNLMNYTTENLVADFSKMWNTEIYVDGNEAGNEQRYHGRGTFLNYKAGMTSDDRVAQPEGTYAGLSIELGDLGGSASNLLGGDAPNTTLGADWPEGTYTADFDATSPLILNWSSERWNEQGDTDWANNAPYVLSYANEIQGARGARESRVGGSSPIVSLITPKMKNDFEMKQRELYRIDVPLAEGAELGFPEVYKYNGVYLAADAECPHGEMHQLAPGTMEWANLTSKLWEIEGPTYMPGQLKYIWLLYNYGNFRFQPKAECFAKAIA